MQLVQIDATPDYIRLLRKDSRESQLLVRDLLINVTQFFRNNESFEALETEVIPKLIERIELDETLRAWVPGCASGEDAYSVAILLKEGMSKRDTNRKVQIFATDLDDDAVRMARMARFPGSIASDMSRERFERWFAQEGEHYCPQKSIREMCVFPVHDMLKDPPFSKLDLISCRNLFIYFNASLQMRLLEAFHYALRPGGYLFPGSSEGVSQQGRLFEIVDKKHRIFQRKDVAAALPGFPLADGAKKGATPAARNAPGQESSDRLWRQVLTQIGPACVVVNQNDETARYFGQTGRYLEPSPGAASLNLFTVLRPELRQAARSLLQDVRERGQRRTQTASLDSGQWIASAHHIDCGALRWRLRSTRKRDRCIPGGGRAHRGGCDDRRGPGRRCCRAGGARTTPAAEPDQCRPRSSQRGVEVCQRRISIRQRGAAVDQ
jgi:two-component system, chemotaxis family, CheB/CheR fusion protein